jgi:hemoglobin-like flavoprotein
MNIAKLSKEIKKVEKRFQSLINKQVAIDELLDDLFLELESEAWQLDLDAVANAMIQLDDELYERENDVGALRKRLIDCYKYLPSRLRPY